MQHLLTCQCGKSVPVSRSQAGSEITCECGAILKVPKLRELNALPVVEESTSQQAVSSWGGKRGFVLAVSSTVFLLFFIPCLWFLFQRWQIDTSYTVDSEIAQSEKLYDSYGPVELISVWLENEKIGLGQKQKPPFYFYKKFADDRVRLALITGAGALLAAIVTLATVITAPKSSKSAAK